MYFKNKLSYTLQISTMIFIIGLFIPVGIVNGLLTTQWFGILTYAVYISTKKCEVKQFKEFKKNVNNLHSCKRARIFYKAIMASAVPILTIAVVMIAIGNLLIYMG